MDDTTQITTRSEFLRALHALLDEAVQAETQELWLVDPHFADWPLNDRSTIELLTRWGRLPQRRLMLIAQHYDEMPRRHPRFVDWRRSWSHVAQCRAVPELDLSEVPTLLLTADGAGLQLIDREHFRGRLFRDETTWRTWREVIDALLQRSEDAFPATTLGL